MVALWREWIAEKINPAQPSIASAEGEAPPANIFDFKTAYNDIEIINRAVTMIINACVEIPFIVEGGPAKKLTKLLNTRPNPWEDRVRFYRRAFLDFIIDGNVFFFYDKQDEGDSLYIIPANDMTIIPDKKRFINRYIYSPGAVQQDQVFGIIGFTGNQQTQGGADQTHEFQPDEIIHISGDSIDGILRGDSKLEASERLIEVYYAMIDFQRQFFKNNAIPGFVLTTDNVLSRKIKERLLEDWKSSYTSIFRGARSPAILDGGLKIDKFSTINFQELDFESSVDRIQQDMAKALGVPYVLMKSGNNANIGVNQVLFYLHTILPMLEQFASAFVLRFGPDITIVPDKKSISALRPDTRSQAMFWSTLVNGGIATPAEAREDLRLEKLNDPECEKIRVPQNIAGSATNPAIGGRPSSAPTGEGDKSTDEDVIQAKDWT